MAVARRSPVARPPLATRHSRCPFHRAPLVAVTQRAADPPPTPPTAPPTAPASGGLRRDPVRSTLSRPPSAAPTLPRAIRPAATTIALRRTLARGAPRPPPRSTASGPPAPPVRPLSRPPPPRARAPAPPPRMTRPSFRYLALAGGASPNRYRHQDPGMRTVRALSSTTRTGPAALRRPSARWCSPGSWPLVGALGGVPLRLRPTDRRPPRPRPRTHSPCRTTAPMPTRRHVSLLRPFRRVGDTDLRRPDTSVRWRAPSTRRDDSAEPRRAAV